MATFEMGTSVNAPLQHTFDTFSDFRHAPQYVGGIERLEIIDDQGGAIGTGTRFRETRVMFGKEATEEMEITSWDPPNSYVVEADSCGAHYRSTFLFEPGSGAEDLTIVKLMVESQPITFMAKLMSPLGFLFAGTMKKMMQKDLEDLRAVAERNGV